MSSGKVKTVAFCSLFNRFSPMNSDEKYFCLNIRNNGTRFSKFETYCGAGLLPIPRSTFPHFLEDHLHLFEYMPDAKQNHNPHAHRIRLMQYHLFPSNMNSLMTDDSLLSFNEYSRIIICLIIIIVTVIFWIQIHFLNFFP